MEFRDAVKFLRSELGLTQLELATALHVNPTTVIRWEKGQNTPVRSITPTLMEFARSKSASKECLTLLEDAIASATKERLDFSSDGLYAVEHASLRQLIDEASFPIYVCDLETDELLYLNRKATEMIGGICQTLGRKCYDCLMHLDAPCPFCHKDELTENGFKEFEANRVFDGKTYRVQGKLIQWNGRRAQVRYVLGLSNAPKRESMNGATAVQASETGTEALSHLAVAANSVGNVTESLQAAFESVNGGVSVAVLGNDGRARLAYASAKYYELFGYTKEQFATEMKNPHDTLYPEDAAYAGSMIKRVKTTHQPAVFTYRAVKRDGSVIRLSCSASVSFSESIGGYVLISVLTDITVSESSQQQTILLGERLSAIMNNVASGVAAVTVSKDGSVEYLIVNDRYYEMLGFTKEQYYKEISSPFDLIYSEDSEKVRREVTSLQELGKTETLQYRIVRRDGRILWINARISIMSLSDADKPVQLAVLTDITNMVEAGRQLKERHDQLNAILNATPGGVAIIEVEQGNAAGTMNITYYNDRFIGFSGYTREEFDALPCANGTHIVFDEDAHVLFGALEKICVVGEGVPVDATVRCHVKTGGYRWLLLTGQLVGRNGKIDVINMVLVDITARKEAEDRKRISEEMLRIAAETDKRAIIIYNVKANTCRAESKNLYSVAYSEIIYDIPESLLLRGLVSGESAQDCRRLFARIRDGEQKFTVSLLLRSGKNDFQWFECNVQTVFDVDGQPDHAVLVFHDITEQRVKEAVFRKWQQSIEARPPESYTLFRCNLTKGASLDEFDGELLKIQFKQTDMTFNQRTVEYADEYVYPDDRQAYTALLDSDTLLAMFYRGEHAAELEYREMTAHGELLWRRVTVEMVEYPNSTDVQAFLMYENIDDAKKAQLEAKEIAESDPLTGVLNRAAFAEKVDTLIATQSSDQHALLMVDMDGFKQLNDTFGHAAGDQALQDITAVLRSFSRNGDLVGRLGGDEFMVWLRSVPYDAVIGKIVQQMCEHIQKAYSKEVILSASIGIAVYPRDGQDFDELYRNADKALYKVKQAGKGGSAFYSVSDEEQTPKVAEALSSIMQAPQSSRRNLRRLLIVDDNEINRLTLKSIFKDEYLIETAKNGAEAMIRLRHFGASISVVLLDLFMPGMDGFAVLKKMQANVEMRTIPVIVVSGDGGRETLLRAVELGAADYVTKPVDEELIRLRVKSAISKAENERLRAQNSYLQLQRDEEVKFRTVLESTGTVVIEYDWRNHVFIYDGDISKHIAGTYDNRGLWQVFLSDMIADSVDVKAMQDMMIALAGNRDEKQAQKLIQLKTPGKVRHWFRMNIYKSTDEYGLADKMILTFNDVHEEVLANERLLFQATRDELTGLFNRAGFIEQAAKQIAVKEPGYYVVACIDIEKFTVINDQYGTEKGDEVLRQFGAALEKICGAESIACRVSADNFALLYPAKLLEGTLLTESHQRLEMLDGSIPPLKTYVGRCIVDDKTLGVSAIYDRAVLAKETVKGRYDVHIATYDESMRVALLRQQAIIGQMNQALAEGQFEVWLQPQFNHATGKLYGAEALVRWRHPKEGLISPGEFIPIFERNGFVYEVDKFVWEQVCKYLRKWMDQGLSPVPVSVNISRYDVFRDDLVDVITHLVKKYDLPMDLLRLEITESAFAKSGDQVIHVVKKLTELGFTVEIDDFGSGYSSLNTLKDVPAQVLKLDMRFLENDVNAQRGGSIIESVVRMAKWLGMSVIAEGVETLQQADYLKSIGCEYVQGYLYSRPEQVADYEELFEKGAVEAKRNRLQTVESWNNNAFWNPDSMETLIFNSYVGGACIFEYHNGKTELLRHNDEYAEIFGAVKAYTFAKEHSSILEVLDAANREIFTKNVEKALETKKESTCEISIANHTAIMLCVRVTVRLIAQTGGRSLFYTVVTDITKQRVTEIKERDAVALLKATNEQLKFLNDTAHNILAQPDSEQAIQKTLEDMLDYFAGERTYIFELDYKTRTSDNTYEICAKGITSEQERLQGVPFEVQRIWIDSFKHAGFVMIPEIAQMDDTEAEMRELLLSQSIHSLIVAPLWRDKALIGYIGIDNPTRAMEQIDRLQALADYVAVILTRRDLMRKIKQDAAAMRSMSNDLLDNLSSGVALYEFDGEKLSVIHINKRYWQLVGRERVDYSKASVLGVVHPEDQPMIEQEIEAAIRQGRDIAVDFRVMHGDGDYRPFHVTATVARKADGKYLMYASYTPISDNTMSIQELIPIAIATMMSASDNISYVKDKDLRYLCCSQSVAELHGSSNPREFIGKSAYDLFEKKYADKFTADDVMILKTGKSVTGIIEYVPSASGAPVLMSTSKYPILDTSGNAVGVYCLGYDITAQRQKESQLELLTSTIPGGLAEYSITQAGLETLYFNDGYYVWSGYTRDEYVALTKKDALALIFEEDRACIRSMLARFENNRTDNLKGECAYRCHTKAGGIRYMSMKAALTQVGDERYILNVVQLDITEQKEAERKQIELLDNLPCGAALYDFDGEHLSTIHINKRYEEITGRALNSSKTELSAMEYIHPDDRAKTLRIIRDAIALKTDAVFDIRILYGNDEYRAFHLESRIKKQANGHDWLYVTYSYMPEHEATFSETLPYIFSTMMQSATDIAFAKDRYFRYLCCSHAYAKILGLANEKDVVGKTDYELFGKEIADRFREDDVQLTTDGKPIIDKLETVAAEKGLPFYARVSKYLLRDTVGNILGIYGIGRDITERQEASDQLKLLTETIPGGLATFACAAGDYRLEYYNDGFCTLLGCTKENFDPTFQAVMSHIFEEDRPMVDAHIATLVENGTAIDCIYRIHTMDGGFRWINHKAIVVDHVRDTAIINAVFLDVTQVQEEKERLRVSEELNRLAIEHGGNIITRFDVKTRTLTLPDSFNPIFNVPHILYNMPQEQIALGRISPATADAYTELFESIVRGSAAGTATYQQNSTKGWRWLEAQYTTVFSSTGEPVSAVISFSDITERLEKEIIYKKWQQSLAKRPENSYTLFRCNLSKSASFDSREGTLLRLDIDDAKKTFDDRTAEYVTQCVYEEDRAKYLEFMNPDALLAGYYRGHRSDELEYRERAADGEICWRKLSIELVEYPNSKEVEAYLMFEDIDGQKKAELLTLERSESDPLTGILNRSTFIAKMEEILRRSAPGEQHALFMLDIDNFKHVNDTLGHSAGDQVLRELTRDISAILRHDDLIGRLGGDEFFVFLKGVPGKAAAVKKAKQICDLNVRADGSDAVVTASIGIAMIPADGDDFDTLYKKVDTTLYQEKKRGKDGYLFVGENTDGDQRKAREP